MLNVNEHNTRRYAFYPNGIFEVDEEDYPGQYDPVNLTEIEFSYELYEARTLGILHEGDKKFVVIGEKNAKDSGMRNTLASAFLLSIRAKTKILKLSQLRKPLHGTVIVIEVR